MEVCLLAACLVNTVLRHYRGTRDVTSKKKKKNSPLGKAGNTDNWAVETDEAMKSEKCVDTRRDVSSWRRVPAVEMQTEEENRLRKDFKWMILIWRWYLIWYFPFCWLTNTTLALTALGVLIVNDSWGSQDILISQQTHSQPTCLPSLQRSRGVKSPGKM